MGHQSGGPELPNISEALERGAAGPALPSQALLLAVRPPSELIHLASLTGKKHPQKTQKPNPVVAACLPLNEN